MKAQKTHNDSSKQYTNIILKQQGAYPFSEVLRDFYGCSVTETDKTDKSLTCAVCQTVKTRKKKKRQKTKLNQQQKNEKNLKKPFCCSLAFYFILFICMCTFLLFFFY